MQSDRYLRYGTLYRTYVMVGRMSWFVIPTWARYGSKQDVCYQGNQIHNYIKKN